ncbi:glycosyltransferase family 2 protein [Natronorubrum daqingense]|uniref:Glycosyl transferase n=1 Tax=Natronorubrum daqingense TaxID=588898 RepID=A0A1N7FLW2_9EURY|nr:glycosyltransferase family 2 protein [Natronorubrum daqingense]APX98387.1 glycosyl transferase [Natronorubrum daqingense]SIS01388.1 Glycosyltransferase involved in cell wall bisynthesis [Natronorubrum daqingense]
MTTVSVITPTYNRADTLPRAIESVLEQRYDHFEHVIVDDGSTDDTASVVDDYDDDRIEYIRLEGNNGANAARNEGIRAASGEYVAFLDSDDEYYPGKLEACVDTLDSLPESYGGVFHGYDVYRGETYLGPESTDEGRVTLSDLGERNVPGSFITSTFRRSVFEEVGFLDEAMASSQDYEFYLRVARAYDLYGLGEIFAKHYRQEDSISLDLEARRRGKEQLIERHDDVLTDRRHSHHHYLLGISHGKRGEMAMARRELARTIRLHPTNPFPYVHLATCATPGTFAAGLSIKRTVKRLLTK